MNPLYYIGLMSGTSSNSIDAALIELQHSSVKLLAHHSEPLLESKRQLIINLFTSGSNEIQKLGMLDTYLGNAFAEASIKVLSKSPLTPAHIRAIGSHGQTIRHQPVGKHPFTLQIGDPNIIAAQTGITTIADFRRRDLALGGQGAPLAPGFHAFLLSQYPNACWVLNIGGIANLTYKPARRFSSKQTQSALDSKPLIGFDTGPGNCLLDAWCYLHTEQPYDDGGQWAAEGRYDPRLLKLFLSDPYFSRNSPKSTGREYFNLIWLQKKLAHFNKKINPVDVQATLLELTACSISQAAQNYSYCDQAIDLFVCGGGYYNSTLMKRLASLCRNLNIESTEVLGIAPEWVEAAAFAWLAHQTLENQAGNVPSVTGADRASLLGAIYPVTALPVTVDL